MVTRAFTGRPARGVRNRFVEEYLRSGLEPLAFPWQGMAMEDIYRETQVRDEGDYFLLLAGQGLRMLKGEQGAAEIVAELVDGARETLGALAPLRGD